LRPEKLPCSCCSGGRTLTAARTASDCSTPLVRAPLPILHSTKREPRGHRYWRPLRARIRESTRDRAARSAQKLPVRGRGSDRRTSAAPRGHSRDVLELLRGVEHDCDRLRWIRAQRLTDTQIRGLEVIDDAAGEESRPRVLRTGR
jgi:hypothetical protein